MFLQITSDFRFDFSFICNENLGEKTLSIFYLHQRSPLRHPAKSVEKIYHKKLGLTKSEHEISEQLFKYSLNPLKLDLSCVLRGSDNTHPRSQTDLYRQEYF